MSFFFQFVRGLAQAIEKAECRQIGMERKFEVANSQYLADWVKMLRSGSLVHAWSQQCRRGHIKSIKMFANLCLTKRTVEVFECSRGRRWRYRHCISYGCRENCLADHPSSTSSYSPPPFPASVPSLHHPPFWCYNQSRHVVGQQLIILQPTAQILFLLSYPWKRMVIISASLLL